MSSTALSKAASCPPGHCVTGLPSRGVTKKAPSRPPSWSIRNVPPGARLENDGSYVAPPILGSGECVLHLLLGAVVGVDEIRADQENNEVNCSKFFFDCRVEMLAGLEHPVVPDTDQTFAFECTQMYEKRSFSFSSRCAYEMKAEIMGVRRPHN
jgi:hypothetical protein